MSPRTARTRFKCKWGWVLFTFMRCWSFAVGNRRQKKNNEECNFGYYEILNKNFTCFILFFPSSVHFFLHICLSLCTALSRSRIRTCAADRLSCTQLLIFISFLVVFFFIFFLQFIWERKTLINLLPDLQFIFTYVLSSIITKITFVYSFVIFVLSFLFVMLRSCSLLLL